MSVDERIVATLDFIQLRKEHYNRIMHSCVTYEQVETAYQYYNSLLQQIYKYVDLQCKDIPLCRLRRYRETVLGAIHQFKINGETQYDKQYTTIQSANRNKRRKK